MLEAGLQLAEGIHLGRLSQVMQASRDVLGQHSYE